MTGPAASSASASVAPPLRVLVTGATGYIGGRLVPRLLDAGHHVRVLARDRDRVAGRDWASRVEVAVGDLLQPDSLADALHDIDVAVYLVHSMTSSGDFATTDRAAASGFGRAAQQQGVGHVVYLGGLQPQGHVSDHLESRAEVGRILAEYTPVTELRAGPIIGSGSASFEMVRYLTERLPVMVAPKWIRNEVQPIAIRDTLHCLLLAVDRQPGGVIDIGGERLTFQQMMLRYGNLRGLRRWIIPVPVLAPRLAARWVGAVTPIPNRLAVPLVEGVVQPVIADTSRMRDVFPEVEALDYDDAVALALERTRSGDVETSWSGALGGSPAVKLSDSEGMIREDRLVPVDAPPAAVFAAFTRLGGETGWLRWRFAWTLRGILDKLVGGPGLRRGRRHPTKLAVGDPVDFWRVEELRPNRLLRLRAEMKLPGRAWLEFEAVPSEPGESAPDSAAAESGSPEARAWLRQTALFEPRGVLGPLYWYLLYPLHKLIFSSMARAVARLAESISRSDPATDRDDPDSRSAA